MDLDLLISSEAVITGNNAALQRPEEDLMCVFLKCKCMQKHHMEKEKYPCQSARIVIS